MRVVVAENNRDVASWIRSILVRHGHSVETAGNAIHAIQLVRQYRPDVLLLDWMLPESGGIQVCRDLRSTREGSSVPIILLVQKTPLFEDIRRMDVAVDDFLVIPFTTEELLERLNTVHRRSLLTNSADTLQAGEIEMDVERWSVHVDGEPVALTVKEFRLLQELLQARGRVLTREFLLDRVWHDDENLDANTRTVDVHIGRLRRKLGKAGGRIATVRNLGYKIDLQEIGRLAGDSRH